MDDQVQVIRFMNLLNRITAPKSYREQASHRDALCQQRSAEMMLPYPRSCCSLDESSHRAEPMTDRRHASSR